MKKIFTLSVATLAFAACNNSTPQQADNAAQEPTATEEAPMEGDDRDEHGCIGTAGYTWSALREECIQVFEVIYYWRRTEPRPKTGNRWYF